jgi:YNFM family putative membrane transporter
VAFSGFAAFLGLYMTQPLLPTLEGIFHASKAAVSLTLTATTMGVAIAAPLIGAVADRLGRKRVIVWSACGLACSTLLDATATGLASLVFWRFLQGLFTPGVFAVTIAYVQEEWADGIGRALAIYVTATVLGGFAGRMLSALIVAGGSWRFPFLAIGAGGGALALMVQAWLPQERNPAARAAGGPLKEGIRSHLRNPRLLAAFAVGFGVLFSLVATFSYVTFHLAAAPFHLGPVALGLLFCTYLFGAVVTPPCGRYIDRCGHRKVLAIALGVGMAGMLLTLVPSLWVVIAGLALCCSSVFVAQATATGFIGVAAEHDKAVAVGLYVTCYYMGGSAGAELPGLLWRFGGWPACVALVMAVQALAIVVAFLGWGATRARPEHDPERHRRGARTPRNRIDSSGRW